MKQSNNQTYVDQLRDEIQRSFNEKLKKIQETNNRALVSIQKYVKQACGCQEVNKTTFVSIQNVNSKTNQNTDRINRLFELLLPRGKTYATLKFYIIFTFL